MNLLSSRSTAVSKWVFPVVCAAFVVYLTVSGDMIEGVRKNPVFIAGPVLLIVFGYVFYRLLVWNLADTVVDGGDHLVITRRGIQARVPLEHIVSVRTSLNDRPRRVFLRLDIATPLGTEIVYLPKVEFGLAAFSNRHSAAQQLLQRADAARARLRPGASPPP